MACVNKDNITSDLIHAHRNQRSLFDLFITVHNEAIFRKKEQVRKITRDCANVDARNSMLGQCLNYIAIVRRQLQLIV